MIRLFRRLALTANRSLHDSALIAGSACTIGHHALVNVMNARIVQKRHVGLSLLWFPTEG